MKISCSLIALATVASGSYAFVPRSTEARTPSSLFATVEKTKLVPPKKVEDLASTTKDLYDKNVQTTYG